MYVVIRFIQILEGRLSIVILRFNGVLYPPASVCDMYIHTTVYSNMYILHGMWTIHATLPRDALDYGCIVPILLVSTCTDTSIVYSIILPL